MKDPRRDAGGPLQLGRRRAVAGYETRRLAAWLPELDRHRLELQLPPQPLGHGAEVLVELALAKQTDHVVQDDRLPLSLLGFTGALPLGGGELAGDGGGQQEEEQRHPLFGIRDG
jgi:hypothetical protein